MKLPITDQFLLDVYDILEKGGDITHFFFSQRRTMRDIIYDPDDPRNKRYIKELSKDQFRKLVYYLKKNNWIKVENLKSNKSMIMTKEGIDKAIKASFKVDGQQRSKRKDGKWIMIIFDIPKRDEKKRGVLRSILQNLGYKMFQKSVWITPYDVFEKTERSLQFYLLDKYVKIFLIEELK